MNLQDFKEAIKTETDHLDFVLTMFNVNDNLQIKGNCCLHNDWDEPSQIEIKEFDLTAKFFGEYYNFTVTAKRLKESEGYGVVSYIESLDEGKLMSSFEEAIEGEYWVYIKALCERFEELEKEDLAE